MIVVQTTTPTKDEAKNIAALLVKKQLAACVQIVKIDSIYVWEDQLCDDSEHLLLIKTKKVLFDQIQREIKENHSYDVPEIIACDISNGSKEYLQFIEGNTI